MAVRAHSTRECSHAVLRADADEGMVMRVPQAAGE